VLRAGRLTIRVDELDADLATGAHLVLLQQVLDGLFPTIVVLVEGGDVDRLGQARHDLNGLRGERVLLVGGLVTMAVSVVTRKSRSEAN